MLQRSRGGSLPEQLQRHDRYVLQQKAQQEAQREGEAHQRRLAPAQGERVGVRGRYHDDDDDDDDDDGDYTEEEDSQPEEDDYFDAEEEEEEEEEEKERQSLLSQSSPAAGEREVGPASAHDTLLLAVASVRCQWEGWGGALASRLATRVRDAPADPDSLTRVHDGTAGRSLPPRPTAEAPASPAAFPCSPQ